MANKNAAKKAIRSSERKKVTNNARKNRIRTFVRKVSEQIKLSDSKKALESFKELESEIMRGVTKKIIKLNTASRKLSRISAQIKKISA